MNQYKTQRILSKTIRPKEINQKYNINHSYHTSKKASPAVTNYTLSEEDQLKVA